jgi:hypothetical protein
MFKVCGTFRLDWTYPLYACIQCDHLKDISHDTKYNEVIPKETTLGQSIIPT